MTELRAAEEEALDSSIPVDEGTRWVGGRLFQVGEGVWEQAGLREEDPILRVEPFSRAYFDLLDLIPELRLFAQMFREFEIQGGALRIRIQEGGATFLSPDDLRKARMGFRTGYGGTG